MFFVKSFKNNSLLDDFSNIFNGNMFSNNMRTDISENENEYTLDIEMPGVKKDEININFEDNSLIIEIKQEKNNESNDSYIRKERTALNIRRSYYLENIDENSIKAKLNDGILKVIVPKKELIENKKTISIE